MNSEKLLRMKKVTQLLNITTQTLRHWSKEGFLTAIKGKGGHYCFKLSEILHLMRLDPYSAGENKCLLYRRVSTAFKEQTSNGNVNGGNNLQWRRAIGWKVSIKISPAE